MSDSLKTMDCSLPGSSVHGIFQAKYWCGFNPGVESLASLALAGRFFTTGSTWEAHVQKKALYYLAIDRLNVYKHLGKITRNKDCSKYTTKRINTAALR